MSTLYVTEQGAYVERDHQRLVVTRDDAQLIAVPIARVTLVVLVGRVGISTPALHSLLEQGADVLLLNGLGRPLGRVSSLTGFNRDLRVAQYAAFRDGARCLCLAQAVAGGKLHNYRAMAQRLARNKEGLDAAPLARIEDAIQRLPRADDLASVRGVEGGGTRAYFCILRQALNRGMGFERRERRPPPDPINALLSLGYTLLGHACRAACESVGLDPYDGFYHADKYGRPALALDLMEEFRSLIVDSIVLDLVNREMLTAADFEAVPGGGVHLCPGGLRVFFRRYAARLQTNVSVPGIDHPLTYQKIIEVQARKLRRVVEGAAPSYEPYLTR